MCSALNNDTPVQYNDLITVTNRGQSVRYYDAGNSPVADRLDDFILCLGIQRGSSFVQNADRRILRKTVCNLQSLSLSAGEVLSSFKHPVSVTVVTLHDIIVNSGITGCKDHFEIFDGIIPHLDISGNRIGKQRNLLIDDRYRAGKYVPVNFRNRYSIVEDLSAPGLAQTAEQLCKCGFSASGSADKCHLLPRLYRHAEIPNERISQF